jgi:hypothetical protein
MASTLLRIQAERESPAGPRVRRGGVKEDEPSRLDQELRPRARAQRGREPPRLLADARSDQRPVRRDVIQVPAGAEGSIIRLRKLAADYDPTDTVNAITHIARAAENGEVLTGLLFVSPDSEDLHAHLNTYEAPFNKLGEGELCPGSSMLDRINAGLR